MSGTLVVTLHPVEPKQWNFKMNLRDALSTKFESHGYLYKHDIPYLEGLRDASDGNDWSALDEIIEMLQSGRVITLKTEF